MVLKVAKNSQLTDVISEGTGTNPITTEHPIAGSAVKQQVYLFNDNNDKRYENILIEATGTNAGWVAFSLTENGSFTPTLSMADIADITGKPFWVQVTAPAVSDTQNIVTTKTRVSSREYAK